MFAYDTLDLIDKFFEIMKTNYLKKYDAYKKYYDTLSYSLAKEKEFSIGDYTHKLLYKAGFDILEQNLSLYAGEELKIKKTESGRYISQKQVQYIFRNLEENNLITAPTNSGKTYSFIEYAKRTCKKIIFLSPYTSTTEQTYQNYRKDQKKYQKNKLMKLSGSNLGLEYYNRVRNQIEEGITNVLVATYDKAYHIQNLIGADNNFILIIDEAHNITNQYEFRKDAIESVKKLEKKVNQTIYLTATPIGLDFDFDKIFNFKKNIKLSTSKIMASNNVNDMLEVLKSNRNRSMIDIIRINNKKEQFNIKNKLVKRKMYNSKEILILNSNLKDSSGFKHLINEEKIKNEIRLVITTSLIDDGVNIKNDNINNLYFFKSLGINSLIQFPNRIRKKIKGTLYVFTNLKKGKEFFTIKSFYRNYLRIAKNQVKKANLIWEIERDTFNHRLKNNELIEELNNNFKNKFVDFDYDSNEYIVNNQQILLSIKKKLDGKLCPQAAKKVLKNYAKFQKVEIIKPQKPSLDVEIHNNEDYFQDFLDILSNYEYRGCFLAIAIDNLNLDVSYPSNLVYTQKKEEELRKRYSKLDQIIFSNNISIKKVISYLKILKIAKIFKEKIIKLSIYLYFKEVITGTGSPNLFKSRLASAIGFFDNKLLKTPERFKLQQIEMLEHTNKSYDELRKILEESIGKNIKSPKSFLKKFFRVEREVNWCPKEKKSKSNLQIGKKFDLDSFYNIKFTELKKAINEDSISKDTKKEIQRELKVVLFSNYK